MPTNVYTHHCSRWGDAVPHIAHVGGSIGVARRFSRHQLAVKRRWCAVAFGKYAGASVRCVLNVVYVYVVCMCVCIYPETH